MGLNLSRLARVSFLALLVWLVVRTVTRPQVATTPVASRKGVPTFRQRLVAVGDLHGDIRNAQEVLRMAKVIDDQADWIAGTDILVQTGDIVDRGAYAFDIYRLMQKLRGQASAAGGQVVSILGNHEVMNGLSDWRYVTKGDIERFGSSAKRQDDLSTEGWLGREWLANYSTTALIPLSPYPDSPKLSFTHGSLRPSFPHLTPYPSAINDLGRSLLRKAISPPLAPPYPPNPYSGLPKDSTTAEAALYDSGGPYWWRGLAEMQDEKVVCGWAKQLQEKTGAKRIIGGHTPNFERIVDRCNASIIIIDTGISSAYGGVLSALEVIYTLTRLDNEPDHRQDPLTGDGSSLATCYIEREEIYAIYRKGKQVITIDEKVIKL
ncbi:Metallo-dependent phosphatase-like protein [Papiliotrema laurentii]|uniref:Metallo-dependent phosphatase-like protein n=1 Tax=Papiliotrema laurentii TaxID=5418 RepID=A0AAD9CRZ3_PAPLA|nr:Metallo-dependent phosphatase-like protein [Papiliotrema laurentii]